MTTDIDNCVNLRKSMSKNEEIKKFLKKIESNRNIKILYACESGSRAWGFDSKNSDYDVRFIYCRNVDYYISIDNKKDVIEIPIQYNIILNADLDCSGWDIRKVMKLLSKSNASCIEWLNSRIKYLINDNFYKKDIFEIISKTDLKKLAFHYFNIAKKRFVVDDESAHIKLKNLMYVLRSLLALMFIVEYKKVPPINIKELMSKVGSAELLSEIDDLLEIKKDVNEDFVINYRKFYSIKSFIACFLPFKRLEDNNLYAHINQLQAKKNKPEDYGVCNKIIYDNINNK